MRGDRAENLERALHHYTQALEVRTRQAFPADWAMTQNNLAIAYTDRIRGDRAENLELAIHHYTQALEVYTRQADPRRWAGTQNNLANAYADRIRGDRAENLELPIADPPLCPGGEPGGLHPPGRPRTIGHATQNNLATAYTDAFAATGRRTWSAPSTTTPRPWR